MGAPVCIHPRWGNGHGAGRETITVSQSATCRLMSFKLPSSSSSLAHANANANANGAAGATSVVLHKRTIPPLRPCSSLSTSHAPVHPLRCAVLGAGFAGLSVVWHLFSHSPKESNLHVDLFDEVGIGGGASGVSGGLLHPYSPKVKLLWKGAECWRECLNLLNVAEAAAACGSSDNKDPEDVWTNHSFIARRRGILRPAVSEKNLDVMLENAQSCLTSCRIEVVDKSAAQKLVPYLCIPLDRAFFMPKAVNINPQRYIQALFLACKKLVEELQASGYHGKSLHLQKKFIVSLSELEGEYDAVIVCLGARVTMLPELSGELPLRTCRGVIAHLQLPDDIGEDYPDHSPSILSDAWLAAQGCRSLHLGATWEWGSTNYSPLPSSEETSMALKELLPKASVVYTNITRWTCTGAKAGLRAMPPLTPQGSYPLLGCIDHLVGRNSSSRYWLVAGLGSRGLLYHGWLGKLTAEAVLSDNEDMLPSELTSWMKKSERSVSGTKKKEKHSLIL